MSPLDNLFATASCLSTIPLVAGQLFSDNAPSTVVVITVTNAKAAENCFVEDVWVVFELVDVFYTLNFRISSPIGLLGVGLKGLIMICYLNTKVKSPK